MFQREIERRKANKLERIPGLREKHVIRDSWTRLNVYPSKIMQVTHVIQNYTLNVCLYTCSSKK